MPPTRDPQALLSHDRFLRDLAARLAHDGPEADDLVQETYARGIVAAPAGDRPLGGWLATVLRNVARRLRRSDARRHRRALRAARPEAVRSPEAVLERERIRREVVDAVLRLDAPYRDVVLLRFYDGLPPREVARSLGVGVETVRTRTRRALERLRTDLSRRHPSRASWELAAAPLAGGPSTHAGILGGIAMSAPAKLSLLAVLLLLALGGVAFLGLRDTAPPAEEESASDLPAESSGARLAGLLPAEGAGGDPAGEAAAAALASRAARPRGLLRGYVVRGDDDAPVPGARVEVRTTPGSTPYASAHEERQGTVADVVTDARGAFLVPDLPAGAYTLSCADAAAGEASVVASAREQPTWTLLRLSKKTAEPKSVCFRVVGPDGAPVAGASVELLVATGPVVPAETTGVDGLAGFDAVVFPPRAQAGWPYVLATGPSGRALAAANIYSNEPQDLVLQPAGGIEGRVLGPSDRPVAGVRVEASLDWAFAPVAAQAIRTAHSAADGMFRFDDLAVGAWFLRAEAPDGLRLVLPQRDDPNFPPSPFEYAPLQAKVEPGRATRADVQFVEGGRLRGRVVRRDTGAPVQGAQVEVELPQGPYGRYTLEGALVWRLDASPGAERIDPTFHHTLRTDASGSYELADLLPGPWLVTVLAGEGLALDRRADVAVSDGSTAVLEHRLEPAGSLELVGAAYALGLRRRGAVDAELAWWSPMRGTPAVRIPDLAAGEWTLLQLHSDPRYRPIPLADVTVRAGETTFLDASELGNLRVSGRLRDATGPVAGARFFTTDVGYKSTAVLTDDAGRFAWTCTRWGTEIETYVALPEEKGRVLGVTFDAGADADLVLPSGSLSIRVMDTRGDPISGARVRLSFGAWRGVPRGATAGGMWSIGWSESSLTTDAAGVVGCRHLPPGEYVYEVRFPSGLRAKGVAVVGEAAVEVPLREEPTGSVRVRVEREEGSVSDARVGARWYPPGHDFNRPRHGPGEIEGIDYGGDGLPLDPDGAVTIPGVPSGTLRVTAWVKRRGHASSTHFAMADVAVATGGVTEVPLRLAPVPPPLRPEERWRVGWR